MLFIVVNSRGGTFSRDFTVYLAPQCMAFSTALKIEKLKAPLSPPPEGAGNTTAVGDDVLQAINEMQLIQEKIVPITLRVASSLCCVPCTDKILSGDAPTNIYLFAIYM